MSTFFVLVFILLETTMAFNNMVTRPKISLQKYMKASKKQNSLFSIKGGHIETVASGISLSRVKLLVQVSKIFFIKFADI